MKRKNIRRLKVTVALWLSGTPGRNHLTGVLRFANMHGWDIHILQNPSEFTIDTIRNAVSLGTDGFIIGISPDDPELTNEISAIRVPVVSIGNPEYCNRPDSALISYDDVGIGAAGAKYLVSLGNFNSFGFVPDSRGRKWSYERQRGFTETLSGHGRTAAVFNTPVKDHTSIREQNLDAEKLERWLTALPKPAAVMAAWDYRATQVLKACRNRHIEVPGKIALLGVDNDTLLCENMTPQISSINPFAEDVGFAAAKKLAELMRKRMEGKPSPRSSGVLTISRHEIVERESTSPTSPSAHLVKKAVAFIRDNACNGIKVPDVVEHLGVSRRLADMRFRELQGESIREAIEKRRLLEVKRLLQKTSWPITRIAAASGYASANRLSHVFSQRFGMSMLEWRARS